jgi:hypothetical protein
MTPKLWFRMFLGMFAIFAVGMLLRAGFHKGRNAVTHITEGSGSITIPLLSMPFRVGDATLGTLQRVRIDRSAPKVVSGFHLFARLDDTVALARFDNCRLTVIDPNNLDEKTSFACASVDDSSKQAMVAFGTVTLQPSGREFVLLIPESVKRDLQNGSGTSADASSTAGETVDIATANAGSMDIKVNGKSILSMKGDSNGGHLIVHDENGKEVVNMSVTAPPAAPAPKKP